MGKRVDGLHVAALGILAPLVLCFVAYAATKTYAPQGIEIAGYQIMAENIKTYAAYCLMAGGGAICASELADFF